MEHIILQSEDLKIVEECHEIVKYFNEDELNKLKYFLIGYELKNIENQNTKDNYKNDISKDNKINK